MEHLESTWTWDIIGHIVNKHLWSNVAKAWATVTFKGIKKYEGKDGAQKAVAHFETFGYCILHYKLNSIYKMDISCNLLNSMALQSASNQVIYLEPGDIWTLTVHPCTLDGL